MKTRTARSGKTKYGERVILKDNSKTRVNFVPFFIEHSDHIELAGKIVTFNKTTDKPTQKEEKSISLSGDETRKLFDALKTHLAVANDGKGDGEYLVVDVGDKSLKSSALTHDPSAVVAALTTVLGQPDIVNHLRNAELSSELRDALKNSIRIKELATAVNELRDMLESGVTLEKEYQKWCDAHHWAFGPSAPLSKNVRTISISDQVDKILADIASGFADLIELKRPSDDVLRYDEKHRNYYFSSDASQAIGQCHRYLDVLHDVASKGLMDHPEIVAYHPRATIVMGRSNDWPPEKTKALHGLNQRLRSINIITFDHLLAQSQTILSILNPVRPTKESNPYRDLDDEIPF